MFLTLSTCNSRAGVAEREYPLRHQNANVFRRLEQRLCETGSVTRKGRLNAGRPWILRTPTNEDATTAAVERATSTIHISGQGIVLMLSISAYNTPYFHKCYQL
jgi:hypothetical protein